jgi:parvulin-like peptidyl-prolyl isomerase
MRRFIREPLVHFLFLGALIFFTASFISLQNRKAEKTIIISNEKIGSILRFYQIQNGSIPTKQQLDAMIEDYIREEIFYREALNLRLDKDDEIIRRRLSQKMEFLQSDLTVVPEPSQNTLRKFYESNPGNFRDSGLVSFTHIYFSADKKGEADAKQRALSVKANLIRSNTLRNPQLGDPFSLQYDYNGQNKLDIVQLFGNKPILDSLFDSPLNLWIGPVQSGYGWHLLRISERTSPRIPSFETIVEMVKEVYMANMKNNLNKAAYEKLIKKYFIRRDYLNFNE